MEPLYSSGNLTLYVEKSPIGGFRGQVGTLRIEHKEKSVFTEWETKDLADLALINEKVLFIHEKSHVSNTLIFGKQQQEAFSIQLVPYPKCNIFEKVQGAYHVVFGSPTLKDDQIEQIKKFYSSEQFERSKDDVVDEGEPSEKEPLKGIKVSDPFCRQNVLDGQRIAQVIYDDRKYDILHDNRPKGAVKSDPHILIIPEGDTGHVDGSSVPQEQRLDMLKEVQKAMKIFAEKGCKTLLYIERNGAKLQGVHHKHSHATGIKQFPETFYEKCVAFIRLAWAGRLSETEMKNRIEEYSPYYKPKVD